MRVVIQRTASASVAVNGNVMAVIGQGFLILLGVEVADTEEDAAWLAMKIAKLRLFPDAAGLMNLSIQEVRGSMLVVSQFTLHAATKKGNRPSFIRAARPEQAIPLYEYFVAQLRTESDCDVTTGEFGADMKVSLVNDGPVTIWMDSKAKE